MSQSLLNYGSLDYFGSIFITLMFIIIISIPYAFIGLFNLQIRRNSIFDINLFALLFVAAEFIKSITFGGFPWLLVGHSQSETIFNFIYPNFGSYAVTYIVIFLSAIISKCYFYDKKSSIILIVIFPLTYYLLPVPYSNKISSHEKVSFTIYQPNIYPKDSYDSSKHSKIQKKYIDFLNKKISTDLVILPETIVTYELLKSNSLYKKIRDITNNDNIVVAGLFTKENDKYYNSMVFFSQQIDIYNKRKLVPFGEYTPWYNTVIKLAEVLNIPLSNLSHGLEKQKNIYFKDIKIIPVICFESAYPDLINSTHNKEVIVNISNDSWFGDSLAPYQHLQISQVRALEFNRFILRATNTGISAVIDNNGRVINHIPNNTEDIITGNIPVNNHRTIYSQYGDIGILMLLFLSLLKTGIVKLKIRNE